MLKKSLLLLIVISLIVIFLPGCGGEKVGSGIPVTKNYEFSGFDKIEADSGFELSITQAFERLIIITTDDNIQDKVEVTQTGDTIYIGFKGGGYSDITLKANIAMPNLGGINLSGGAKAMITGFLSSESFSVTMTEGSVLIGDIIAGDAGFGLSGGSMVTLTGSGGDLVVRSSEGSEITLDEFAVNNADINIDSGKRSFFNISGRLDTVLTGGSELYYTGEAEMGEVNVSGGSKLEKR